MKKTIIAVLAAALVTVFFIGCNGILDDLNLNNDQKQKQFTTDGKVKVRINLGTPKLNARTIYPDTSEFTTSGTPDPGTFPAFLLFAFKTGQGYVLTPTTAITSDPNVPTLNYIIYNDFSTDLELTAGTYKFTVFACKEDEDNPGDYFYLAWGSSNKTIVSGTEQVDITLKEIIGASIAGTWDDYVSPGKFTWEIDNPPDSDLLDYYDTATLTLTEIGGNAYDFDEENGSGVEILDLKDNDLIATGNNAGSLTNIPSGYYMMVIQLTKDLHQTIYVREVIHIWSGFETTYTTDTLPQLRSTQHTVTFHYNDPGVGSNTVSTINHGSTISNTPTHTGTAAAWSFKGWFYDDTTFAKRVGNDKVINTIDVFAKWNKVPLASDYVINNRSQTYGGTLNPVTATGGTSPGGVSITRYEGTTYHGDSYSNAALPTEAGSYTVTFEVAAVTATPNDWDAATFSATLTIAKGTPQAGDFKIGKLAQTTGKVVDVEIEPWTNKSKGDITIYYNGGALSTVNAAGSYAVTFDVDDDEDTDNWKATTGLSAGTLIVSDPEPINFTLDWSADPDLGAPYNHSEYDINSRVITIDIGFTTKKYDGYTWEVNILGTPLTSNRPVAGVHQLKIELGPNDATWDDWTVALSDDKKFTITLTVDGQIGAEYIFTIY